MAEPIQAIKENPQEAAKSAVQALKGLMLGDNGRSEEFQSLWSRWSGDKAFLRQLGDSFGTAIRGDARIAPLLSAFKEQSGKLTVRPEALAEAFAKCNEFIDKRFPAPKTMEKTYGVFFIEYLSFRVFEAKREYAVTGKSDKYDRMKEMEALYGSDDRFAASLQARAQTLLSDPLLSKALTALQESEDAKVDAYNKNLGKREKPKAKSRVDPAYFLDAVVEAQAALAKGDTNQAKRTYGAAFVDEVAAVRKGSGAAEAAAALAGFAQTGDPAKAREFMDAWSREIPRFTPTDLTERQISFIDSLREELSKRSPQLQRAAEMFAKKQGVRQINYAAFCESAIAALADLKKQEPGALKWMQDKYPEPLITLLASRLEGVRAKEAAKNLAKVLEDPTDTVHTLAFVRSWQSANAAFAAAFRAELASSTRLATLVSEYEKRFGVLKDERSANAMCKAVQAIYDDLRSSTPQPSRFYPKYGAAFVNAVGASIVTVAKTEHTEAEVKEKLDGAESKLEQLEAYFKGKGMNMDPRVRDYLDERSDALRILRQRTATYEEAEALYRKIPTTKHVDQVIKGADMDIKNLVRVYNAKNPKTGSTLSYAYTITDSWITRMETLLGSIQSTKAMAGLGWLYDSRLRASGFDITEMTSTVATLKYTVGYIRTIYQNLGSTDLMKDQLATLQTNLNNLSIPVSGDFKTLMSQAISQTAVKIDSLGSGAADVFWKSQIQLIDDMLKNIKPEFRDRVTVQFYSDWHEEETGMKGYASFSAAMRKVIADPTFISDRAFMLSELKAKTIEYQFSQTVPGQQPLQQGVSMNANGEVYNAFNSLSLETQYELLRQFREMNPSVRDWDNTMWAKFGAVCIGLQGIPGSHAPLLLKRISSDAQAPVDEAAPSKGTRKTWGLLSYDPNSISAILGVISGYSTVFYPGGHYRELSSYYNSLPGKLNKLFTDIFTLKDEIKEEYTDVRIIKPTEQNQFAQIFIPAARIVVQIPKHVYEVLQSGQLILEVRQAAPVTDSSQAPPDILRTERRYFSEKAIEGRLMLPVPGVMPLLAMNKAYLLAPSYIPEVGDWYNFVASEAASTAWEKQTAGGSTTSNWQALSSTSATATGEGKSASATYTLQRGSGMTSVDEGTATFTNLSFNELSVPDSFIADLREFKGRPPQEQAAAWKALQARLTQKLNASQQPLQAAAQAQSAEARMVAAITDQVTGIRLTKHVIPEEVKGERVERVEYEATVLSDRGEITRFTTKTSDVSSKAFSDDFWGAIGSMRSSELTTLRKRRMDNLADAVNVFMDAQKAGSRLLENPEAARVSSDRMEALRAKTARDILAGVDSLFIEQVMKDGRPIQSYTVEARVGTTVAFSFTTVSDDASSEQFRHDFWRAVTETDAGELRGKLKGKGMEVFAAALETFNLMGDAAQVAVLSDMQLAAVSSERLVKCAIFANRPKEKRVSTEDLADRILDSVSVRKMDDGKCEVTVGSGVAIGSFQPGSEAESRKSLASVIGDSDPDAIYESASTHIPLMPPSLQRNLFGAGRNAVNGNVYVRHEDDRYTQIKTAINAVAPGGADTAVYFERTYQGTQGQQDTDSITAAAKRWAAGVKSPADFTGKNEDDIAAQMGLTDSQKQELAANGIKPSQLANSAYKDWSANPTPSNQMTGTHNMLAARLISDTFYYRAYVFKRIENGSFVLADLKSYTPAEASQLYQQTIGADANLAYRMYSRLHPVMGVAGEGELENSVIFAGNQTVEQGYGAAYQKKRWGGYALKEETRGGRATAGMAYMNPDERAYYIGRLYVSDIKSQTVYNARTGTTETERGYYAQCTMLQSARFRADAFVGKQSRWEAGGVFDYLADSFYFGGGFLRFNGQTGGRAYLVDRNMVNAAVASGIAQSGQWKQLSAGGRYVIGQLNLEVKGGVVADRAIGKGGFLRTEYRPDMPMWGFRSLAGSGFLVTGEREVKIAGTELAGPHRELDTYWSAGGGGLGELKLHYPHWDVTTGGAGNVQGIVKYAGWGGVRLKLDPATVFLVGSVGKELTPTTTTDSTGATVKGEQEVRSAEGMLGARIRLSSSEYDYGRSWSVIAAASGIEQKRDERWGRQYDLQIGALGASFHDNFRGTVGYQYWENNELERQAATWLLGYSTKLPAWVFRDTTLSLSGAYGKQITKLSQWEQLYVNVMFNLSGTF